MSQWCVCNDRSRPHSRFCHSLPFLFFSCSALSFHRSLLQLGLEAFVSASSRPFLPDQKEVVNNANQSERFQLSLPLHDKNTVGPIKHSLEQLITEKAATKYSCNRWNRKTKGMEELENNTWDGRVLKWLSGLLARGPFFAGLFFFFFTLISNIALRGPGCKK